MATSTAATDWSAEVIERAQEVQKLVPKADADDGGAPRMLIRKTLGLTLAQYYQALKCGVALRLFEVRGDGRAARLVRR